MAKKNKLPDTYGKGFWLQLFDDVHLSTAYKALTPLQRLILIDMIRTWARACNYAGAASVSETGIMYTYASCAEVCDEGVFYTALKAIEQKGWFCKDYSRDNPRPGKPHRHFPSTDWRNYKPTSEEGGTLRGRKLRKETTLAKGKKRLVDYGAKQKEHGKNQGEHRGKTKGA